MPVVYVLDPPIGAGSDDPDTVAALPAASSALVNQAWVMRANCSLSPGQLLAALGSLALTSLIISLVFWWLGAPWVLPFAGLEVLGLLLALVVYARRANDLESVLMDASRCTVECRRSGKVSRVQWPIGSTRVRCDADTGGLVELSGGGHRVRVGRHLGQAERTRVARAMQQALQRTDELAFELK